MKKIIGIILILVLVIIIAFVGFKVLNKEEKVISNEDLEQTKDISITGVWRAYGYLDTAYFDIKEDLSFTSYYANGNQENIGKIKIDNNDKTVANLETIDGKKIMSIDFDDKYAMFNIKEDTNKISYIKDLGDAISEDDIVTMVNADMYMLNEVLKEEFSVEFSDNIKKAAFKTDDPQKQKVPEEIFDINDDIPPQLYLDQLERSYYKVENFKTMQELKKHLEEYFTVSYLKEIQASIEENFMQVDSKLYLVRGSRGYGAGGVDFNSINIETTPKVKATVDTLFLNEKDKTLEIEFVKENKVYKINKVKEIVD